MMNSPIIDLSRDLESAFDFLLPFEWSESELSLLSHVKEDAASNLWLTGSCKQITWTTAMLWVSNQNINIAAHFASSQLSS